MLLRKVNPAEAVLEAWFDGGDSDMRFDRKSPVFSHYTVETDTPELCRASQAWANINVAFDGCRPGGSTLTLRRELLADTNGYDTLRIFAAVPARLSFALLLKQNGVWAETEAQAGSNTTRSYDFPLPAGGLEGIGLRVTLTENLPADADFKYLSLVNLEKEQAYIREHKSVFTPDWEDYVADGGFAPALGLWFDGAELAALRKKVRSPILAPLYEPLRKTAEQYLTFEPEKEIDRYVPHGDRRWVCERDLGRTNTSSLMSTMAFVGLIEERADMMRMAVRMALSIAHCEYWCESVIGTLPGCSWHHRSFTEESYARGVGLVLDWAGSWLSEYGRNCLRDALAMKALPRMESDYRRMEYIRHMNQGICFNWGRVTALLALEKTYPRYDLRVEDAEKDLWEMIDSYVLEDGGTMEGPGYWTYTFSQAMPQFYLLSRRHGGSFMDYASEKLLKTGEHALALLSITGKGNLTLPLNDAHTGTYVPSLMAAFYRMTHKPEYAQVLSASFADAESVKKITPSPELLILLPDELPEAGEVSHREFTSLPNLGQARIIRDDPQVGPVSFHLSGGPAYFGHYHYDKGAFILETRRETLAIDRGVTEYSHPDTGLFKLADWHNMAIPEQPDGALLSQRGDNNDGTGARLTAASYENGVFFAETDTTGAWAGELIRKSVRSVRSEKANEFLITDTLELSEALPVSFRVNTRAEAVIEGSRVILRGREDELVVEAVDWTPAEITFAPTGIDEHQESVNLLRIVHGAAERHVFTTRLTVRKKS